MTTPRKHAELIKLWADGAEVEVCNSGEWTLATSPAWSPYKEYRIKPKPDVYKWFILTLSGFMHTTADLATVMATFDGETGTLKTVERV